MAAFMEGTRSWQPREMAMVSEFIAKFFPRTPNATRVRLGIPHPELVLPDAEAEDFATLRLWNRWADAIVYHPDKTILIEAKIRPRLGPTEAL